MKISSDTRAELAEHTLEAIEDWTGDGLTEAEALDRLAAALDLIVDFQLILGPLGALIEPHDEKAFRAILGSLQALAAKMHPDPDRLRDRAARAAAKGRPRLAARRLRRAQRIEIG